MDCLNAILYVLVEGVRWRGSVLLSLTDGEQIGLLMEGDLASHFSATAATHHSIVCFRKRVVSVLSWSSEGCRQHVKVGCLSSKADD